MSRILAERPKQYRFDSSLPPDEFLQALARRTTPLSDYHRRPKDRGRTPEQRSDIYLKTDTDGRFELRYEVFRCQRGGPASLSARVEPTASGCRIVCTPHSLSLLVPLLFLLFLAYLAWRYGEMIVLVIGGGLVWFYYHREYRGHASIRPILQFIATVAGADPIPVFPAPKNPRQARGENGFADE